MAQLPKILIFERDDAQTNPGGDTVQIHQISNFLKKNQFEVIVTSDIDADLTGMSFIIIFNLQLPDQAFIQAQRAVNWDVPYIFFPVYWDMDQLKMKDVFSVRNFIKKFLPQKMKDMLRSKLLKQKYKSVSDFPSSLNEMIKYIFMNAAYICPNSKAELQHLIEKFSWIPIEQKAVVVHNGIKLEELSMCKDRTLLNNYLLPESYICCVGTIGPRKNQINLVKAANSIGIPLVIVGKVAANDSLYGKYVKKIAKDNVIFLNYCDQHIVYEIIKHSKGHIQPSYIETPGLASLEAVALSCNVVVSDVPPVREYFGDSAYYVNPNSYHSIAEGMIKLYNSTSLPNAHIFRSLYNWDTALMNLLPLLKNDWHIEQ
ncbi:glycosyltransferase [Paenibacillus chungangensis]|uniref:Glycosyltransferase n=1 Tax=Paenibacillus chungangensis TaxID=696535 RepID=A0ABW3HWF1_9BACL